MRTIVVILLSVFMQQSFAGSEKHMQVSIPKELESMKQLVGTWQGKQEMEGKEVPITVEYSVTSSGTAITEKLMSGTPHEMVSVYHKNGDSVAMTHYCGLGNQPFMKLKKSDGKVMSFEMHKAKGITSKKEPHMHAVTLTVDGDNLTQDWVYYEDGKQSKVVSFNLTRAK